MNAPRRTLARGTVLVVLLVILAGVGAWFLQGTIPRRIVLASGPPDGLYHSYAQRYREILAEDGVTVDERQTEGAAENARLLLDPKSGVDVAFMQGGVVQPAMRGDMVMLASLYYEPLWVFYRDAATLTRLSELRGRRVAIGPPGSGVRAFVEPLLAANGISDGNTQLLPLGNLDALGELQAGKIDAAMFVGQVQAPAVIRALRDPSLKLLNFARAEAYQRRFPHITRLTLPPGAVDFARNIPAEEVGLIATEAMLVARESLSPPIVFLLHEAAREIHSGQGYFEKPREFPNTDPVDIPASAESDRHLRFGPSILHRYLPFFVATYVERLIILLIPLLFLIVPIVNLLPQLFRWRARSRIYRWYGQLALLERDVASRTGSLPIDQWLAQLDRIEAAAARIKTPVSYASEAYTLREHIGLVRRAILSKAQGLAP